MIVYEVCAQVDELGAALWWEANQRDAEGRRREIRKEHEGGLLDDEITIRRVYIPKTKKEMLRWLNANVTNDNS